MTVRGKQAALALLFVLAACHSIDDRPDGRDMPRLEPADWMVSYQATQFVTINYRGKAYRFVGVLAQSSQDMTLVGLSTLGQKLFVFTTFGVHPMPEDSPLAALGLSADAILGLVQFALWPVNRLAPAYIGDWHIEAYGLSRQAFYRGRLQASVNYSGVDPWSGTFLITDHARNLTMEIKNMDYQTL